MPSLSRKAAIPTRWDETSFIDAATRKRPQAEADLIWRLVEHASVAANVAGGRSHRSPLLGPRG
jgi:hypothetical protein